MNWTLPFAERYERIRRDLRDPERFAAAWPAWCRLQVEDADQLESLLAHRTKVWEALTAAGWELSRPA